MSTGICAAHEGRHEIREGCVQWDGSEETRLREELAEARRQLADARFRPMGDNHHNAAQCPYCGDPLRAATARATAAESALAEARGALRQRDEALRWVLGEAPLPDGRVFDREAFGYGKPDANDRNSDSPVGQFWWRIPLRLHSGIAALARAGEQETPMRESRPCTCGRTPLVHRRLDGTITIHCACGLHLLVNPAQPAEHPAKVVCDFQKEPHYQVERPTPCLNPHPASGGEEKP